MKAHVNQPQSLIECLVTMFPDSSKTTLRSWVKEGRVRVDGIVAKRADQALLAGQEVSLERAQRYVSKGLTILYSDAHLVVVNKPHGLLSVATDFEEEQTVHALLKDLLHPRQVYAVHRLDQDTSGLMLFALGDQARDKLKSLFEKHAIERGYTALVEGRMAEKSGTWSSYLYEDEAYYVHSTMDAQKGRLAITHFEVEGRSATATRLKLRLETGRKNQIRVHCQDAGHPVLGDLKYGGQASPIGRLCLHAHALQFIHPFTGKPLSFTSDVPEPFSRVVRATTKR